jgi:rubrerythrin
MGRFDLTIGEKVSAWEYKGYRVTTSRTKHDSRYFSSVEGKGELTDPDFGYFDTEEKAKSYARHEIDLIAEWEAGAKKRESHYSYTTNDERVAREKGMELYTCHECGARFFAYPRSKYSPSVVCPICDEDDLTSLEGTYPELPHSDGFDEYEQ